MVHHRFDIGVCGNSGSTSSRLRRATIALGLLYLVALSPCRSLAGSGTPPIKVVSASRVIIRLDAIGANFAPITAAVVEDLTPCLLPDPKGAKYACSAAESSGQQPVYKSTKLAQANSNPSGVYVIEFATNIFSVGRLYRLTLEQTDPITQAVTSSSLSIDTSPSVAVALVDLGSSSTKLFRLTSMLGFVKEFTVNGTIQKNETVAAPVDCVHAGSKPGTTPITITGTSGSSQATLTGWKMRLDPLAVDLSAVNPAQIGAMDLCLDISTATDFAPDGSLIAKAMDGIESPLGPVTWSLASGTKLVAGAGGGGGGGGAAASPTYGQPSPAAKSAASFYANVTLAAATGASFAWGLDGKISEFKQPIFKPVYITWLSATANTI